MADNPHDEHIDPEIHESVDRFIVVEEASDAVLEKEVEIEDDSRSAVVDKIVSHLLFHKALSGDNIRGTERINRYIEMVHEIEEGRTVLEDDPYERTISIAFELLLEERMNPWDIDLARFADFYLRRLDAEHLIDLRSAGRVIRQVWSILRIKSERVLDLAMAEDFDDDDPYDDVYLDFMDFDAETDYKTALLQAPEAPINNLIRRAGSKRPATLMELITALRARDVEIGIVLMTGYPLEQTSRQTLAQQTAGWVQKPLTPGKLGRVLAEALATKTGESDGGNGHRNSVTG